VKLNIATDEGQIDLEKWSHHLCCSHRYKNYTVVITIWLIITKYPYLKWQWIFYFLRRCFFPLSLPRVHHQFFGGVRVAICVVLLCVFVFLVSCCAVWQGELKTKKMSNTNPTKKTGWWTQVKGKQFLPLVNMCQYTQQTQIT
jgi:hypothetical protein